MGHLVNLWRRHGARTLVGVLLGAVLATGATSVVVAQDAATPTAADCNVEQAVAEAPLVYTVNSEQSTASTSRRRSWPRSGRTK